MGCDTDYSGRRTIRRGFPKKPPPRRFLCLIGKRTDDGREFVQIDGNWYTFDVDGNIGIEPVDPDKVTSEREPPYKGGGRSANSAGEEHH